MKVEKICCDRCGALMPNKSPSRRTWLTITTDTPVSYFQENAQAALEKISEANKNNDMTLTLRVETVFSFRNRELDLCPKCTKELNKFLFNYKETNQ